MKKKEVSICIFCNHVDGDTFDNEGNPIYCCSLQSTPNEKNNCKYYEDYGY